MVLTAADLSNEAFGFKFQLDKIIDFFVEHEEKDGAEVDIAKEAHEKLIEFARANIGHFIKFSRSKYNKRTDEVMEYSNDNIEIFGRIDTGLENIYNESKIIVEEFSFTVNAFKKITRKLGYEDDRVLLKQLKEKGYLNHEQGKLYRKRKLRQTDATATKMYVLYEFQEAVTTFEDTFLEVENEENPFEE